MTPVDLSAVPRLYPYPLPITYHRLLSRGDLPESAGGLYNPGAFLSPGGKLGMLVRREEDYTWTKPCHATACTVGQYGAYMLVEETPPPWTIPALGYDTDARLEDYRPFLFQGDILVAHIRWKPHNRTYPIKPVLSMIHQAGSLERYDDWNLPHALSPVEKNWVLFEYNGLLHCVYQLSPLIIFAKLKDAWVLQRFVPNGWCKALGKTPRNSTHLYPFYGGYLGWWHILLDQSYVTGAYWLDDKLELKARTGILLDGQWVRPAPDIYKAGVLYVSSQVHTGDDDGEIHLFYGEGDSHSGVATMAKRDVAKVLGL